MSELFCRLCLYKKTEYFTINEDFRDKILKHLDLQISENVLVCKLCTERLDAFVSFYLEVQQNQLKVHEEQQQSSAEQVEEIRYIILLKDDKAEIQLEDTSETEQQNIPIYDAQSFEGGLEANKGEQLASACDQPKSSQAPPTGNIEGFPKALIKDGKLLVKGKELSKLIAKFYRLECSICPSVKKFKRFTTMISHFRNEHSAKGFVECCGLKIAKIRQIAMHMARHIQPEAFQCSTCNKMLTCPKILQYHMQNHLPEHERSLACPEPGCPRRFSYQSALATHSISHLPEQDRTSFPCEICGRRFSTAGRLSAHVGMVHSVNPARKEFTCKICSKKFLCRSNLSYHETTHKDFEFQVECTVCKKWLKNKICLRKHMTIHSEVRHFCDICEYSAANKQCLINHKKIQHSDMKPFSCSFCSKTFKLKNTLTNHVNAHHNGLRKYSCEFCTKTFVSSGNYYSHRKRMHPKELSTKIQEKESNERKKRLEVQNKMLNLS